MLDPWRTLALDGRRRGDTLEAQTGPDLDCSGWSWAEVETLEVVARACAALTVCAFGDPLCPCQDGDPCHYVDYPGSPAMPPPSAYSRAARERLEPECPSPTGQQPNMTTSPDASDVASTTLT